MNDSILYPKEQRIFTVLLVIAQVLFLLEKKSYNAVAERIDRLKGYANRQLKKEEFHRAIQFIRLLQQLAKSDYKIENMGMTEKYYNKLVETPFFYSGAIHQFEVIPYEKLWNLILSRLK